MTFTEVCPAYLAFVLSAKQPELTRLRPPLPGPHHMPPHPGAPGASHPPVQPAAPAQPAAAFAGQDPPPPSTPQKEPTPDQSPLPPTTVTQMLGFCEQMRNLVTEMEMRLHQPVHVGEEPAG